MYKKNHLLKLFFITIAFTSLIKLYDNSINLDAWQYGEWLINYQNGFIRRGIVGEIIYLLSSIINNNINISFIIIVFSFCSIYYYLSYIFIKKIEINIITLLIIFSPLFYLFFVIISKVGIKKEIIFYIYYIYYLIYLEKKSFSLKRNWIFIFIFQLLLLNHEGVFFYLPYIIIPLFFLIKKDELNDLLLQAFSLILLSSLTIILLYLNKGTSQHTIEICNSLGSYAPMKCDWWGPIYALSHDLQIGPLGKSNLFFYVHDDMTAYFGFIFYILYGAFPIFLFIKFYKFERKLNFINKKRLIVLFILSFIFSLPLFHFAEDWSRWFSIHIHLITFLMFFLYKKNFLRFDSNKNLEKLNYLIIEKKYKILLVLLIFFYATSLHHHHFFFKGVKLEFTYYKIYKKIF